MKFHDNFFCFVFIYNSGYDTSGESDSDARRHIAVAMVSLLQLQDMLHTSILQQINEVSDRGMAS